MIDFDEMISFASKNNPYIFGILIDPNQLIFEERVKMNCFNCGKYKTNWRCPGNMPQNIDYKKMICEYNYGAFIYIKMPFNNGDFSEKRSESSIILHRCLLAMEKYLYDHNEPMVTSFIGGSCKLCKNGCGTDKCNNPYNARSPLESIGVNVIKSAALYGLDITFPPKDFIIRVGLILW